MQVKNDVNCGFKLEQVKCFQLNYCEKYYKLVLYPYDTWLNKKSCAN